MFSVFLHCDIRHGLPKLKHRSGVITFVPRSQAPHFKLPHNTNESKQRVNVLRKAWVYTYTWVCTYTGSISTSAVCPLPKNLLWWWITVFRPLRHGHSALPTPPVPTHTHTHLYSRNKRELLCKLEDCGLYHWAMLQRRGTSDLRLLR